MKAHSLEVGAANFSTIPSAMGSARSFSKMESWLSHALFSSIIGNTLLFPNRTKMLAPIASVRHPLLRNGRPWSAGPRRSLIRVCGAVEFDHGFWWIFHSYLLDELDDAASGRDGWSSGLLKIRRTRPTGIRFCREPARASSESGRSFASPSSRTPMERSSKCFRAVVLPTVLKASRIPELSDSRSRALRFLKQR